MDTDPPLTYLCTQKELLRFPTIPKGNAKRLAIILVATYKQLLCECHPPRSYVPFVNAYSGLDPVLMEGI